MNNKELPAHPQPIAQIKITIMSDGNVNVSGFPPDLNVATTWMDAGKKAVINYFMGAALSGDLDETGKIIEKKIITQDKKLVSVAGQTIGN